MEHKKVIEELRTKKDEEILRDILDEIEEEKVTTRSPDPEELGLNTTEYRIPKNESIRLMWNTSNPGGTFAIPYIKIANMLNAGLSPIIGIFGKEQTGKSNTALELADTLHNDFNLCRGEFNPANQVVYEVIPFLVLLRHTTRQVIMFDEAGETLNKNDYNSKMNRAVAGSLRTQSKRQIVYIFVTPEASELDPRIREKIDVEIEMVATGKAEVTLYERIHGRKAENKNQRYEFASINEKWDIPKANSELRKQYDKIDSSFKGRYLDELLLDAIEEKMDEKADMLEF